MMFASSDFLCAEKERQTSVIPAPVPPHNHAILRLDWHQVLARYVLAKNKHIFHF